jgi:hypothetical protein
MHLSLGTLQHVRERSPKGKVMLKRYQFMMSVAQSMLNFKDEHDHDSDKPKGHGLKRARTSDEMDMREHVPIACKKRKACTVCQLELTSMNKELGSSGLKTAVCKCQKCGCAAHASIQIDSNRQIHRLKAFKNMTCFEILHSEEGLAIWPIREINHSKGPRAGPMTLHPIVQELRIFHGKDARKTKKNKKGNNTTNSSTFSSLQDAHNDQLQY